MLTGRRGAPELRCPGGPPTCLILPVLAPRAGFPSGEAGHCDSAAARRVTREAAVSIPREGMEGECRRLGLRGKNAYCVSGSLTMQ